MGRESKAIATSILIILVVVAFALCVGVHIHKHREARNKSDIIQLDTSPNISMYELKGETIEEFSNVVDKIKNTTQNGVNAIGEAIEK